MKKRIVLLSLLCGVSYVTLTGSSSGGAAGSGADGTLATGGSGCSCHNHNTTTSVVLELDSAGVPVTRYKPGKAYTIKITGTNTSTTSLPYCGFQVTVVKSAGAGTGSAVLAGTLGTSGLPAGVRYTSAALGCGIDVLEHSARHSPTTGTGGSGTTYVISSLPWTAPVMGTGTVVIYGCINAVNGSGSSGDRWNNGSATITELPASNTEVADLSNSIGCTAYPNPVRDRLTLDFANSNSDYQVSIYDAMGRRVAAETTTLQGAATATISTAKWPAGMYTVVIQSNSARTTLQVAKQ